MVDAPGSSLSPSIEKVEAALRLPIGAASPLWFVFAGAATAGMTYWWMTRWTRAESLEAPTEPRSFAPAAEPVPVEAAEPASEPSAQGGEAAPLQGAALVAEVARLTGLTPEPVVEPAPEPSMEAVAPKTPPKKPAAPKASKDS